MNQINIQKVRNLQKATVTPDYKLFSAGQIFGATLFGSIVVGQLMLALNYVKLKDAKRAARKFISSFGFLVLLAAIPQLIILPTMCFILTFFNEFKRRQNNKFTRHLARGGKQYSKWKVAALCTMFYTIFFLIFFIIRIDSV